MSQSQPEKPIHIKLTREQQEQILHATQAFFEAQFDEELSYFKAKNILDFFVTELGALVYNQAIHDAQTFMQEKLIDLEATLYEPENPYRP